MVKRASKPSAVEDAFTSLLRATLMPLVSSTTTSSMVRGALLALKRRLTRAAEAKKPSEGDTCVIEVGSTRPAALAEVIVM